MNVILDSSIWFEYFKGNEPYFTKTQELLNTLSIRIIDPIIGEILQGALSQKEIRFIREHIQFVPKIEITNLFEKAGEYSFRHKLISKGIGLIDAAIMLSALETDSLLWTLDQKIINLFNEKQLFQIN
jgi:predicted nucleic acid-binding protein